MKSIAFLRKAWKKWYHRDAEQANGHRCEPQKPVSPLSMSILPKSSHPPAKSHDDPPIPSRNTSGSRSALDTTCSAQGSPTPCPSPIRDCTKLLRLSPQLPSSTDHLQSLIPPCTLFPKDVENSVPYQKISPVLQPLDVTNKLESTRLYNSGKHARSTDSISSTPSSNEGQDPQKMYDTVLDAWPDSKPRRTLYHRTRSMPYLRYEDERSSTQASSINSVDASDDNFPLSLFPTPPALIVQKRIPPPLMLRNSPPPSLQSSCESTPVGTPTTPRFLPLHSPSKSSFGSCQRVNSGRRVNSISPPPFNPPISPLPSPPVRHENNGRPLEYTGRPRMIRTAYSSSNLKDAQPFSVTHRLTFSESISNQSSLPIKKSRKPRPEGMHAHRVQEAREQVPPTAVDNNVQWGYAF